MPLDDTSMFIRSYFGNSGGPTMTIRMNNGEPVILGRPPVSLSVPTVTAPQTAAFIQSRQLICSVKELLAGVASGRIAGYGEMIEMNK